MPLSAHCDLEVAPGRYCNRAATVLALSGDAPEMWLDHDNGNACLASFCSTQHAFAEPKPNLAAAKRMHAQIFEMCDEELVLDAWERAIAAFPRPIPIKADA